nr:unnamed protein product [Callosobruchus chinensis]
MVLLPQAGLCGSGPCIPLLLVLCIVDFKTNQDGNATMGDQIATAGKEVRQVSDVSSVGSGNSSSCKRRRAEDEYEVEARWGELKDMLRKLQDVAKEAQATTKDPKYQNRDKEGNERYGKGTVFGEIGQILDKRWPEIAFRTVKKVEENPFKSSQKHDIIRFLDPKQKYNKDIKDIISDCCVDGKTEYIINEMRTSRQKNAEEDRTAVYILQCNIDERGVNDMEGIFNLPMNLRDQVLSNIKYAQKISSRNTTRVALQRLVGRNTEGSLTLGDLRPAKDGNQSATVIASKAVSDLLIQLGSAGIGLILCRQVQKMSSSGIVVQRTTGRQTLRNNIAAETAEIYYQRNVFYPFIDHVISELDARFKPHESTSKKFKCCYQKKPVMTPG